MAADGMCRRYVTLTVCLCWLVVFLTGCSSLGQNSGASVLANLRDFDSLILDEMTLHVREVQPRPIGWITDSTQTVRDVVVTTRDGVWVSWAKLDENMPPPSYQKYGEGRAGGAYTPLGNLRVARRAQFVTLYEPDFRGLHTIYLNYVVSPDGEVSQAMGAPIVHLYDPVCGLESWDVYIPVLSAGRGYSKLLAEITEVSKQDDGLLRCKAIGRRPGRPPDDTSFDWELLVDPDAAYMVRWAKCVWRKNGSANFIIETEGTRWFEWGPLPEKARFVSSPEYYGKSLDAFWEISFKAMAARGDEELIASARKLLRGEFPKGTKVFDKRKSAKVPSYTVGESSE